ncbi:MAG: ArsR/SmtB family transcription factor [Flavobacteriales bacterium]
MICLNFEAIPYFKVMDEKHCVRVYADQVQIRGCKEQLRLDADKIGDMARIFDLAGNEVRIRILFLLAQGERLCVCDLGDILEMKGPAVSQHLRKLYDGGLIRKERVGQTIYYHLEPDHRDLILSWLAPLLENSSSKKAFYEGETEQ